MNIKKIGFPKGFSLKDPDQGISQSLINQGLFCPYAFLFDLNRISSYEKDKKTLFGNIGHDILTSMYSVYHEKDTYPSPESVQPFVESAVDSYKEEFLKLSFTQEEQDLIYYKLLALMENYVVIYKEDFKNSNYPLVEQEYKIKVFGQYWVKGKVDVIKNEYIMIEHKFKGMIPQPEVFFKQLKFEFQSQFYIMLYEQATKKIINTVLYNIVRNPQSKPTKKDGNIQTYYKRLKKDIEKKPEYFFIRFSIEFSKKKKQEFRAEVLKKLLYIEKMQSMRSRIFKKQGGCITGYTCSFLDLCAEEKMESSLYYIRDKISPELEI